MKQYVSILTLTLTTGLMYGAAGKMRCEDCIVREKAQLPAQVEAVLIATTRSVTEKARTLLKPNAFHVPPAIKFYEKLVITGFNKTLTDNAKIIRKANKYFDRVKETEKVDALLDRSYLTQGILTDEKANRSLSILKKRSPHTNPLSTIESMIINTGDEQLNEKQLVLYKAIELTVAFGMCLYFQKHPTKFAKKFALLLKDTPAPKSEIVKKVDMRRSNDPWANFQISKEMESWSSWYDNHLM